MARRGQHHGQRSHPLRTVNQDAFDVGRSRWARVKDRIARVVEIRRLVGILQTRDDHLGVEKHDEAQRQVGMKSPTCIAISGFDQTTVNLTWMFPRVAFE